jgi:hypothetical protein
MEVSHFDESYSRIFGDQVAISASGDAFFDRFYQIFVAKSDDIRSLFAGTDMERQASMLRRSLYELVAFYVTGALTEQMRDVARIHQRLEFNPVLWDYWLDSLVETAAEYDASFDEITGYAWRLAMTPGITYLKLACELGNTDLASPQKSVGHTPAADGVK